MPDKRKDPVTLKRSIGLLSIVMLGSGTAIGVSIFSVLAPAAKIAGPGLLIAIFIAAIPMLFFALLYAYIASTAPCSGASYEWPRRFISPFAGFFISWLRILTNIGAITVLATVLLNYINSVISIPVKPTMALIFTVIFAINYIGISVAAKLQTLLMIFLIIILSIFVFVGVPHVNLSHLTPLVKDNWINILVAVPLMITLFLGIEASVEVGDEIKNPKKTIPLGITFSVVLTAIVYFLISFVALGLGGAELLAGSDAPLFEVAKISLGEWAIPIIIGSVIISILTTLNSIAMIFSRALFAMGKTGVLHSDLAKIHPKYNTPYKAILLAYALAMMGLLLPSNITFLLLAVNIPTMLKYLTCSVCALNIVNKFPDVKKEAALNISENVIRWVAYIAVVLAIAIIILGVSADWRSYALVSFWAVLGGIYWKVYGANSVQYKHLNELGNIKNEI